MSEEIALGLEASCETEDSSAKITRDWVTYQERSLAVLSILLPWLGFAYAIYQVWHEGFAWRNIVLLVAMYVPTSLAIEVGYHRHFAHPTFKTHPAIRKLLLVLGAMAFQGPVVFWAGIHRLHHQHADQKQDPHSPRPRSPGWGGALAGLSHAYGLWLFRYRHEDWVKNSKDLIKDAQIRSVSRHYFLWLILGLLIPGLLGGLWTRTAIGFWDGVLWGGIVRVFLNQQSNYILNFSAHWIGWRPFPTTDRSTNQPWFALNTFGAAWHNNHHAFPTSAVCGQHWWQIDLSASTILLLEKLGLAWDVRRADFTQKNKGKNHG